MTYDEVLSHFTVKKRYQNNAQCICPAHSDKEASLTITRGTDSVLIHCHAGCKTEDVLQAAGLKMSDLFYGERQSGSSCFSWKNYVEKGQGRKIEATYNFYSLNGDYAYTKLRLNGKKMLYGIFDDKGLFRYGLQGRNRKEFAAVYGDVKKIKESVLNGKPVFIPEGEKDVDTLTKRGYAAFTYGGANDWNPDMVQLCRDADVYILADNDKPGKNVAQSIQNDLKGIARSAKIIIPVPDIPKADISDYFEAGHSNEEFEELLKQPEPEIELELKKAAKELKKKTDWEKIRYTRFSQVYDLLDGTEILDKEGKPTGKKKVIQSVRNFEIVLEEDFRFAGKIKYDEFSKQMYVIGETPWETANNYRPWSNYDDSALFSIIQSAYELKQRNDLMDALKNVSIKNKFHPVKDVLNSLSWDGKEHIKNLLPDYLGCEKTEYVYEVMKLFLLGGISRIFQPGCKFDYCLILQGPQGLGKSTFLRLLALDDSWFNDSLDSLDSDKSAQSLLGSWIIELAELKSLARTAGGVDSVKRFLSAQSDKIRLPYERRADVFLRQCIFAGTTNRLDFLQDETGNRRFLIVHTGINEPTKSLFEPEALEEIKQCWAEAFHIYKNEKIRLVLPESCIAEAEQLQKDSVTDDGKVGIIEEYLKNKERTCAIEIWQEALGEDGRPAKWQSSEINNIVDNFPDWKRMTDSARFGKYGKQRGFQRQHCGRNNSERGHVKEETTQGFMKISDSEIQELVFN